MSKLRIDQVNEESLRLYKFGSDDIAYSFDLTLGTVTVNGSLPSDLIVSSAVYCTPVTVQCNTINCTTTDCTTIQCSGRSPNVGTQRVYFPRTFRWAGIVVATEISDRTRSFAVNAVDNSGFNWWPDKGDYCYYIATGIS